MVQILEFKDILIIILQRYARMAHILMGNCPQCAIGKNWPPAVLAKFGGGSANLARSPMSNFDRMSDHY
jgi:hypothetical protein